jgi:hypothetical protein
MIFRALMPRVQRHRLIWLPDRDHRVSRPTPDFVRRLLSALPAGARPPLSRATAGNSFTARSPASKGRADHVRAFPPSRLQAFPALRIGCAPQRHDLVFVSHVFFNSAATSGPLGGIIA